MTSWSPDDYYPKYPGGPYLKDGDHTGVPWIIHNNFDTEKTIEDKVRKKRIFQGLNEQQMWGYIQDEINYARTNAIGLKTDSGNARRNSSADTGPS